MRENELHTQDMYRKCIAMEERKRARGEQSMQENTIWTMVRNAETIRSWTFDRSAACDFKQKDRATLCTSFDRL